MDIASRALDWITLHAFRRRIQWPCWLLDWAWRQQATPRIVSADPDDIECGLQDEN